MKEGEKKRASTSTSEIALRRRSSRLTVDSLLHAAFDRIDEHSKGYISKKDLKRALAKTGVSLSTDETSNLLSLLKSNDSNNITYRDFYKLHETFIDNVFSSFDTSNRGYLTGPDLQSAFVKLGVQITLKEAQSMISMLDPHDPSRLEKSEFHDLYLVLRAKMTKSDSFTAMLWDPAIRTLANSWLVSSIDTGEDGLRLIVDGDSSKSTKKKKTVDPSVRFYAGALSGVIEALILTPLDVTKTRLQLDKSGKSYRGMIDCGRKLFASEGFFALYKGFTPWTAHVVLKNGSRFYFNAVYRRLLSDSNGQVTGLKEFVAGAMAGATEAVMIVTPFEVVKTRLQNQDIVPGQKPKYSGPIGTALTIIKSEGISALWKGLAPTIARQGLNQACSFWSNTAIKKHVWKLEDGQTLAPWKSVVTGMAGAIPGPCLNCPMDVIKTRLMAQETIPGVAPKYNGVLHALRVIPAEEGVSALYKGLLPRLSRLMPSYGIQWFVMDTVTARFSKE